MFFDHFSLMLKTYVVKYFRSIQFSIEMLKFTAFNFCRAR